jgi:hypothetical protein
VKIYQSNEKFMIQIFIGQIFISQIFISQMRYLESKREFYKPFGNIYQPFPGVAGVRS